VINGFEYLSFKVMCGIVGISKKIAQKSVTDEILQGLISLEYRGYDSSGIAILNQNSDIELEKVVDGPSAIKKTAMFEVDTFVGIGHNRWATHGKATIQNAHPHTTNKVALVHNGTIDNFSELKSGLKNKGYKFFGESDTEVISVLMTSHIDGGLGGEMAGEIAFLKTLNDLKGAFALAVIVAGEQNKLYFAKKHSPLLIGRGEGDYCIASDVVAFPKWVSEIAVLEDGDHGFIQNGILNILDEKSSVKILKFDKFTSDTESVGIGEYKTFMLKEIAEQANVNAGIVNHYIDIGSREIDLGVNIDFEGIESLHIVACGTSYYAGCVAGCYFEKYSRIPVNNYIASEFPYKAGIDLYDKKTSLFVFISQSGETLDTINAIKKAQELGYKTLGIVNAKHTSITRLIPDIIYCRAGTEVSVASTKAFTAQLTVLMIMALKMALLKKNIAKDDYLQKIDQLFTIGAVTAEALKTIGMADKIANDILDVKGFIYLGRGLCFGLALEGALKMKEISYIHSEGLSGGEMKHGPIALIDKDEAVVIITHSKDPLLSKTRSTVQEVAARKGRVIIVADKIAIEEIKTDIDDSIVAYFIELPASDFFIYPLISVIPLQFLSHFVATGLGRNVDKPRNLAKSVTVE